MPERQEKLLRNPLHFTNNCTWDFHRKGTSTHRITNPLMEKNAAGRSPLKLLLHNSLQESHRHHPSGVTKTAHTKVKYDGKKKKETKG